MKRLILVAALMAVLPAAAEDGPEAELFFARGLALGPGGPHQMDHVMVLGAEEGFELKTVKGAAYQAEAVTEVTQTLADGNRITRKRTGQVARDGEGRVRRENLLAGFGPLGPGDGPRLVFIHDPEAKAGYVLHVDDKLARKLPPPPAFDSEASSGAAARPQAAPARRLRGKLKDFPEGKQEDLGTQTIEGVAAQGTRTTHSIPAGEIGNERAIEIVHERWYSPELQTVVMSRHQDPRMGETTYRLTNIQRGEPDAALFQVPEDFKLEEGGHRFERRIFKRKGAPQ